MTRPFLIRNGRTIIGDEITAYHREHMSASYHCIQCGAELILPDAACMNCKNNEVAVVQATSSYFLVCAPADFSKATTMYPLLQYVPYQACPKCQGQGIVSKPPYVPGDQSSWSTSSAMSFQCDVCKGQKIIPMCVIPPLQVVAIPLAPPASIVLPIRGWVCRGCGNTAFGTEKPSSCSGNGNAEGCDGGQWQETVSLGS